MLLDLVPAPIGAVDSVRPDLDQRAAHAHVRHDLARDGAGGNAHRGLARAGPARTPPIAHAIFGEIGVVGVTGAELVLDLAVVLRARVDIGDLERDRRAGGHLRARRLVGEHAGEDAHLVGLLALGGVARLAWLALVEIDLDVGLGERDAGRAAVDHAADRRPVAFAPGGDAEEMAEAVVGHDLVSDISAQDVK